MRAFSVRSKALALALTGLLGVACESEAPFPSEDELDDLRNLSPLGSTPLPRDATNRIEGNPEAFRVGNRLFHDPGLSRCKTVSCQSCHDGEGRTVDTPTAEGCDGQRTVRNPPTIINAGFNTWYMWDGRADELWSQAVLPLTNPVEMNSNADIVRTHLDGDADYRQSYQKFFNRAPADESDGNRLLANVGKMLAAYEAGVNRTAAPFDEDVKRFLAAVEAGTQTKDPAYLGLKTFLRKGQCILCHKGATLSDNGAFHNLGLRDDAAESQRGRGAVADGLLDWTFNAAGPYSDAPDGEDAKRLQRLRTDLVTKREELEGAFRTPTLRNVALTAPYMHNGSLRTLEDVVDFYDKGGDPEGTFPGKRSESIKKLGLDSEEKQALVGLLRSLTGAAPPQ
ncbi:cytochrome-c peroxidase [Corallococcus sp. H22C18031201]|uniref:cytochrome-c peroxidase n=1 Tax=Citreicoccus inhibens TaxID=2849499 RepID=UPI000E760FDB|nr:cytochrome c peroxidase [Citreicoccus inhibens]MBU8896678.1 cytochrome-c peroxidase [Citreicoccus inhibens]RJS14728.1 cytochrome-c peroxidase [Corallococcus sp. H22C18031201]